MANCDNHHNSACAGFTGTPPPLGTPPSFCREGTLSGCRIASSAGSGSAVALEIGRDRALRGLFVVQSVVNGRLRSPAHYGLFRMPVFQNASLPRRGISWGNPFPLNRIFAYFLDGIFLLRKRNADYASYAPFRCKACLRPECIQEAEINHSVEG